MKSARPILIVVLFLLAACTSATAESANETEVIPVEVATEAPTSPPEPTATTQAAEPSPTPQQEEPTMPDSSNTPAPAGVADADVTYVRALQKADGTWTFYVTVAHPDTGWEDYADGWDVVLPDGTILQPNPADEPFTRLLLHPHVGEQPFTRSQSGIVIPDGVTTVSVRAHDLVDGFGGQEVTVDLTASEGPDFVIERP